MLAVYMVRSIAKLLTGICGSIEIVVPIVVEYLEHSSKFAAGVSSSYSGRRTNAKTATPVATPNSSMSRSIGMALVVLAIA